jgi:hypothetical protein
MVIEPLCAVCGRRASRVELVPPSERPAGWEQWPEDHRKAYAQYADPKLWRFLFEGIEAGNGLGNSITKQQASRIAAAFSEPFAYAKIRSAGLYDDAGFCETCSAFYCFEHWNPHVGYGRCPQGHGKSLDPLWSPE